MRALIQKCLWMKTKEMVPKKDHFGDFLEVLFSSKVE
jgi:hypothetical protein